MWEVGYCPGREGGDLDRHQGGVAGGKELGRGNGARKPETKRLGCPTAAAHLQGQGFDRFGLQALRAKADERAAGLAATLDALKAEGVTSANALAGALKARGYATPQGGRWTARAFSTFRLE